MNVLLNLCYVNCETSEPDGDSNNTAEEEYTDIDTVEHNIASLFSHMQTVLHVSKSSLQTIVEDLNSITFSTNNQRGAKKHHIQVDDCVVNEISDAIIKKNTCCEH